MAYSALALATVHDIEQQLEPNRTRTFQEEFSAYLRKERRRLFRREIPLGLVASYHTVPYGTVLRGALSQALRARLRSHRPSGTRPQIFSEAGKPRTRTTRRRIAFKRWCDALRRQGEAPSEPGMTRYPATADRPLTSADRARYRYRPRYRPDCRCLGVKPVINRNAVGKSRTIRITITRMRGSPPSQSRLKRLRQFITTQHDRIRFHAARFRGFFHQGRDIVFGDAEGPQTGDLKCLA